MEERLKCYLIIGNISRMTYEGDYANIYDEDDKYLGIYVAKDAEAAVKKAISDHYWYMHIRNIRAYEIKSDKKVGLQSIYGCLLENNTLYIPYAQLSELASKEDPDIENINVIVDLQNADAKLEDIKFMLQNDGEDYSKHLIGHNEVWWMRKLKDIINPQTKEIEQFLQHWRMSRI